MIEVIDNGQGWRVIVDGVTRSGPMSLFAALAEARRWGWPERPIVR